METVAAARASRKFTPGMRAESASLRRACTLGGAVTLACTGRRAGGEIAMNGVKSER